MFIKIDELVVDGSYLKSEAECVSDGRHCQSNYHSLPRSEGLSPKKIHEYSWRRVTAPLKDEQQTSRGRENQEDEARSGRPATVTTEEKIA